MMRSALLVLITLLLHSICSTNGVDWNLELQFRDDDEGGKIINVDMNINGNDDSSVWEEVVRACYVHPQNNALVVRRCTNEIWYYLETSLSLETIPPSYKLWTSWYDTLTKQRELLHTQRRSCNLSKDHVDKFGECMFILGFLHRSIQSTQQYLLHLMRSISDPRERVAILRRWRASEARNTHPIHFETDPHAVLARAILGSRFIPFEMFVHNPEHCKYISGEIVRVGFWEAVKTMRIIRLMDEARARGRENPIFVDVGANIGWYSLAVASQGFSVIAVEPARYNNELFRASIEINGNLDVKLHEVVVTDKVEENSCLRLAPYGNPGVNRANFQTTTSCDGTSSPSVVSTTLDRIVSARDDIHVMKLDIEGYEAKALRGAREILGSENPPCVVILEYIPSYLQMAGETNPSLILSEMRRYGYELYPDSPSGDTAVKPIRGDLTKLKGDRDYEFRWPHGRCTRSNSH